MNTNLKTKAKHDFKKHFYKLMINAVFGKNCGKCKKTDTKLVTTERRNYFLSEPNYQDLFYKDKGSGDRKLH